MTVDSQPQSARPSQSPPRPQPHPTGKNWAGWLLLAYLLALATLVLTVRIDGTGLPQLADSLARWADALSMAPGPRFGQVETVANILVFLPIGFLLAGLWGRRAGAPPRLLYGLPDWAIWLVATAMSAGIELTQLFLLTEGSATVRDLVCNSAGALAGVLIHRIIQVIQMAHHRDPQHD